MSRMIDADRLIEAIRDNYDLNYGETLIDPNEFLDIVEQQPTVKKQGTAGELMPAIHSHWNEHIDYMGEKTGYWLCASCKRLSREDSDFCPRCGAKMDAGQRTTKADKIRNMSDDELAEFLYEVSECTTQFSVCTQDCDKCANDAEMCTELIGRWLREYGRGEDKRNR